MNTETAVPDNSQPSPADDRSLLTHVQSGDEQAMAALFDRYSSIVYSIALRVLGDQALAEDVLQEVFMHLWRNPESFNAASGGLGGWLALHTRSRSIDALRRRRASGLIDATALELPNDLGSEAGRNRLAERARAVLQQLPTGERKTLEAAFFDGLTHGEIAEMTGEPAGVVKSTLRRAVLRLREAVQP